jgi:hypothetical protein
MLISKYRAVGATLVLAILSGHVAAQMTEQQKLLAKRAAEADAYRKLAETIKGITLTSETFVRDFVTESDSIESGLDEMIKGVRLGKATYFDDGICEVEAEVTVQKVIETLKQVHARHYEGTRIVGTDFDDIQRRIKKKVIKVVGTGAPRMELPPDLPQGVEDVITRVPTTSQTRPSRYPPIWKSVTPQGKLMAARAARLDAQRKLLERINGVRINSQTLVRDFVAESDTIRAEVVGQVNGAEEVDVYYHDDELIVEVTVAVPTEQVIRTIQQMHTRHYQGSQVSGSDIERVRQKINRKTFEATGSGVPRASQRIAAAPQSQAPVAPDWVGRKISVVGMGTDPAIDTPQGKLKAIRAATMDARRKLIEQINGLEISSATYVRDFVTERDEIRSQVQSVIAGSVVESQEVSDGVATVRVTVGGPDVWRVIGSQLSVERRH